MWTKRGLRFALVLVSASLVWRVAQAQVDTTAVRDTTRLPDPRGAMLRSILFPGWGQWYNGKKLKAGLVFAVETGLVANAVYQNSLASRATDERERFVYIDRRNQSLWWLAGAVLLSSLDAYVDAQLAGFDVGPDLSWVPGRGLTVGAKLSLRRRKRPN